MSTEEQNVLELLQRYRRDRRLLLNFILSGNLIKKVSMPPGAVSLDDVDLDQVSIDYVLNCVKKGEMLDLSEAIRVHYDSLDYPSTDNTGSIQEFFLTTAPESSGPAPSRAPPAVPFVRPQILTGLSPSPIVSNVSPIPIETNFSPSPMTVNMSKSLSVHSPNHQELTIDDIEDFDDDEEEEEVDSLRISRCQRNDVSDLLLGLPSFATGMTDDDLRETAYEILVASAGAAGGLIVPSKEKKKEKKSRLLRKLARSKSGNIVDQPQRVVGLVGLLETMRIQMEISESMDIRTRRGLLNALVGKVGKRMDTLLVPLELLCSVSRTEFSDKKAFLRWQKRQLNMLEEGLINHPVVGFGESGRKANDLRILLRKIEESESLPPAAVEVQRMECLRSLRDITAILAERPARGDLTGDICHWTDGYHLNVRIYEKMLLSVFDILDEGKLTEEVEEILELLRSTWRILGITETIHDTCNSWVLFRQFVITGEQKLLQLAIQQLRKIPSKEQRGPKERLHLKSLRSSFKTDEGAQDLSLFQSFLLPIQKWTDKKLADYHLHFTEGSRSMAEIVTAAVIVRKLLVEESEQVIQSASVTERGQIEGYIASSVKSAFTRIMHTVEAKADSAHEHVLSSLAEEAKRLLKKDATMFLPIFSERHPQAPVVSASLIHKLYGNKLRPFLDHADHLTEDVVAVLPAAASLECYAMSLMSSSCEEELVEDYCKEKLTPYQVESISGTLVMRWVNSQLGRISSWVERAIQQEHWDPISPQQRHGSSIIEVYRIIEETVDQFFALKVPMRLGELNGLYRGLDNALKDYTQHIVGKIANKEDLIPPMPILTRYKKETVIKALVRKEVPDFRLPDERKSSQINVLSTPTLCVRLNTLHYAIAQLNKLEDNIQERWMRKIHNENFNIQRSMDEKSKNLIPLHQKNAFDGSRKDINTAIDRICEFMGTKIVFWDMREVFIENLYKNGASQSRLEKVIEALDMVLNQLCDIIVEPLRDRTVTGLLQASVDGLVRVLLDGGPSRVFFPSDAKLLEDDLQTLKEFFISGGDGLPRGTVENLVSRIRPIITLHSLESRILIDDLKGTSQGIKSRFGADSETLIRILCHRSDSEASQFLKKQYKIPKSTA
uniref:Envelope glycoprotein n=1 Tax=Anthurium amnicola TaxID=1678845 RepID=A0A1D1XJB6_9ARAE